MTFSLEPLRFLLHPVALLAFAAAAQAWIDGADTRAVIAAVLGVLIAGATEAARRRVRPEPVAARGWRHRESGLSTVELIGILCLAGIVFLIIRAV